MSFINCAIIHIPSIFLDKSESGPIDCIAVSLGYITKFPWDIYFDGGFQEGIFAPLFLGQTCDDLVQGAWDLDRQIFNQDLVCLTLRDVQVGQLF